VEWVNQDTVPHQIMLNGRFDTVTIEPGMTYRYTFNDVDTYTIGSNMNGMNETIIVSSSAPMLPGSSAFRSTDMFMTTNLLSGYGSTLDLMGSDGLYNSALMAHRVVVKLHEMRPFDEGIGNGTDQGLLDADDRFPFDPPKLEINTGTTVTFWAENGHHALESFDSALIPQSIPLVGGQIFNMTFLNPGYYEIHDGFGTNPLTIRVNGNAMSWADVMAMYGATLIQAQSTSVEETTTRSTTIEETTVQEDKSSTTEETTVSTPPAPVVQQPAPVEVLPERTSPRPVRVRDRDMK
jgi:plastocyanin